MLNYSHGRVLWITLFLLFPSHAIAESWYGGASINSGAYKEDFNVDTARPNFMVFRAGYGFNEYMSGEARLGFGLSEGEFTDRSGRDGNVKISNLGGFYLRASLASEQVFSPYVLVGFSGYRLYFSSNDFRNESASGNSISYGLGANIQVNSKQTFNIEYASYIREEGVELNSFSIGFVSGFNI